ncbi:MAG: type II secretion system minor pseudopilin GspH [Gammaproteobacteria bacterium]|nr:type II secretion system minor pseudopilin GspH [Gammaproteobacteria bacterium]
MPVRTRNLLPPARAAGRAFTLIEILVVLVIIGILTAVAFLSFGILADDDNMDREARRLTTLIQLVTDEATTQGRDFGIEFMSAGYRFVEHDPLLDQWFEIVGDDYLVQRDLEEGVEFELYLEERKVLLHTEARETEREEDDDDNARDRDLTDDYLPHVLIMSSGDVTPFELRFIREVDRSEILLTMSLTGELEIEDEDDAIL